MRAVAPAPRTYCYSDPDHPHGLSATTHQPPEGGCHFRAMGGLWRDRRVSCSRALRPDETMASYWSSVAGTAVMVSKFSG